MKISHRYSVKRSIKIILIVSLNDHMINQTEDFPHESTPFLNPTHDENSISKSLWLYCFNLIIAITVGIYAGLTSRSMQESWIYSTIFCAEALICSIVSLFIKSYSLKKALTSFTFYFIVTAMISPLCCWLCFKFA